MTTQTETLFGLAIVALVIGALPAAAADPAGARTVVVPRTHIQVDEATGTVRVTETPQVSQPGGPAAGMQSTTATVAGTAAATAEETPKARISRKDCQRLVRHQARADVTYTPGVDVRGRKVAGADLNGGFKLALPDVYEFNVTRDLNRYLKGPEKQLAAEKAAAVAAQRAAEATDQSVSTASSSVTDINTIVTNAQTTYDAAKTAADAAPTDTTLAAAAATALTSLNEAKASQSAASSALTSAQSAQATATTTTALAQAGAATAQQALAEARVLRDTAVAAAAASPNDATLAAAATKAKTAVTTAETAATAASTAAAQGDATTAQTQAEAALTAAKSIGYDTTTAATNLSSSSTKTTQSSSADADALAARTTVAKSNGLELNVGTVRFDVASGAMTFNGQPINDAARDGLSKVCAEMLAAEKGR